MNIVFVCRKFGNVAGGMERISTAIMNEIVKRGHKVGLVTWDNELAEPHYELSAHVEWLKLNVGNPDEIASWKTRYKRIMLCRNYIKSFQADAIIGFQSGGFVFAYISSIFLNIPCVAAERVSPDTWRHVRRRFIDRIVDTYSLVLASKITVQFPDYIDYYPFFLRKKIITIPNPIFEQNIESNNKHSKILLNVGRLCPQKNQKFLIKSFRTIVDKYPDWKLVIVGDGMDEVELKKLTVKLNLQDHIIFTGAIKNVSDWYSRAEIFVFPSIFEGFPNALSEALSHGLPSVGFEETFGVNDLIINKVNGLLTINAQESFADAIKYLISDVNVREKMRKQAKESIVKYEPEKIFDQWNKFFMQFNR